MTESKGRIFWVDLARALAIMLIVAFHVAYEFTLDNGIRWIGFLGVSLFFIISGFMLAKHDPDLVSFDGGWLWRRYVKIAALYYPAIIVLVLLLGDQITQGGITDLVLHFLFLNGLWPEYLFSIISPAWFMIPLFAFYILYPYLNLLTTRYRLFLPLAVLVTLAVRFKFGGLVSVDPLFFFGEFCFGIAFAHGRRDLLMLAPLALAFAMPVMAVPFIGFYLFSLLPKAEPLPLQGLFSLIGQHTFELFLFHESVMKVALGKWKVWGVGVAASTIVLLMALAAVMKLSWMIPDALKHKEKA